MILAFAMSASLAALAAFNEQVVRFRGEERMFLGAQLHPVDESGAFAWTKCVPESGVFITQASEKIVGIPEAKLRWIAAHEVCHARLHRAVLCSGLYGSLPLVRKQEMETEAEACAGELVIKAKEQE